MIVSTGSLHVGIIVSQAILSSSGEHIPIDGIMGPLTVGAYAKATPSIQKQIDGLVQETTTLPNFASLVKSVYHGAEPLTKAQEVAVVQKALSSSPITNQYLDSMGVQHFISIEDGQLIPTVKNGSYAGLMQMGEPAWQDARRYDPGIGPYEMNRFSPVLNVRAGLAYAQSNGDILRSEGYTGPLTWQVLYTAHNQGAQWLIDRWRDGTPATVDALKPTIVGDNASVADVFATALQTMRSAA